MKMRLHSLLLAVAPLVIAMTVLAGLAPTLIHRSDNFNNNALASFWSDGTLGNAKLHETNSRLEFSNTGPTGAASSAGIGFDLYGINWKKNFHGEFDYKLQINNMAAPKEFFLGTALAVDGDIPNTMTGVSIGLLRDVGGLWVGILTFNGGNITDFDGVPVTQTSGRIEFDWNKAQDDFMVRRVGGSWATLHGYYAAHGGLYGTDPMAISMGVIALNGNITFTGAKTYIDNWEMDFYKRAFP